MIWKTGFFKKRVVRRVPIFILGRYNFARKSFVSYFQGGGGGGYPSRPPNSSPLE